MKSTVLLVTALILSIFITPPAWTDTIGPDCTNNSCYGNFYTLEGLFQGDTVGGDEMWRITLAIDTSGYGFAGEWISQVAIKIAPNNADYLAVTPFSAPAGWTNNVVLSAGFLKDTDTSPFINLPDGTLTWVWDVTIEDNRIFLDPLEASVKATFNRTGPQGQIQQRNTSENITLQQGESVQPIPEPGTLFLLGSGLVGLAGYARKRMKK